MDYDKDSDKAWARQMIGVWMRDWKLTSEAADDLADKLADAFQTARAQSRESIGDLQVKDELVGCGRDAKYLFRVYVQGKKRHYVTANRDIGILLGLGEKYLGFGNGQDFAKYAGRMLGIDDDWTK